MAVGKNGTEFDEVNLGDLMIQHQKLISASSSFFYSKGVLSKFIFFFSVSMSLTVKERTFVTLKSTTSNQGTKTSNPSSSKE